MNVVLLDGIGQRYHVRPSALIEIEDPIIALDFDAAVMFRGRMIELKYMESQEVSGSKQTTGFESVRALQERVAMASGGEDV